MLKAILGVVFMAVLGVGGLWWWITPPAPVPIRYRVSVAFDFDGKPFAGSAVQQYAPRIVYPNTGTRVDGDDYLGEAIAFSVSATATEN